MVPNWNRKLKQLSKAINKFQELKTPRNREPAQLSLIQGPRDHFPSVMLEHIFPVYRISDVQIIICAVKYIPDHITFWIVVVARNPARTVDLFHKRTRWQINIRTWNQGFTASSAAITTIVDTAWNSSGHRWNCLEERQLNKEKRE
jgi:hypothetical protein